MWDDWSLGADYGDYGASSVGDYADYGGYDYTPVEGGIVDYMEDTYAPALDYGSESGVFDAYGLRDDSSPLSYAQPEESAIPNRYTGASQDEIGDLIKDQGIKSTSGEMDGSWAKKLGGLFTDKGGDIDLKKVMLAVQGLGGLYQAYAKGKANPIERKLSPTELQATLPQQNQQWTPQQQIWANKFFNESIPGVAEGNRRLVRAGEGGIKSIMPSQGYAKGGTVGSDKAPDIDALLRQLYEAREEGPAALVPLLSLPQGGARIRIHGSDMAEGGAVPMDMEPSAVKGPLSHGDYGLVRGEGDGQSDVVPINAAPGEYVFDAETVSMIGNGNNDAGAGILDQWREFLREHKRSASPDEIAPPSKNPNEYLPEEGAE